jgi:hypothetical protein
MPIGILPVKFIRRLARSSATTAKALTATSPMSLTARVSASAAKVTIAIAALKMTAMASARIVVRTGWPMQLRRR